MPILKHQECIVVSWDLHPIDRQTDSQGERKLHYLPLVIYVRIPGATWQIHPKFPPGVFPLKSVTREWTINDSTGSKASRRGFTLVPDFASTAFLNQGATLDAEIADCGDVMTFPGLYEMVNAYVILSRIRKADALLLVQAFSHYLFRLGSAPGPACLMKLLRQRFSLQSGEETNYKFEEANAEYKQLLVRWREELEIRKHKGQEWQCFDCELSFPSVGFGADLKNIQDIQALCIKPGHWRRCLACKNMPEIDLQDACFRKCSGCQQNRCESHFEESSQFCMSCVLQFQFKVEICKHCGKHVRRMECADALQVLDEYTCLSCAPLMRDLECTVCKSTVNILAFPMQQRQPDARIRRCQFCSLQCSTCQRLITNCSSFATNSSECWACYKQRDLHTCNACEQTFEAIAFNADVLHNSQTKKRKKVCLQCEELGYSVRDTKPYQCEGGHSRGHLKFQRQLIWDFNREQIRTIVCLDCIKNRQSEMRRCEVCKQNRLRPAFDQNIWNNAVYPRRTGEQKGVLICLECQNAGYWPKDCETYSCVNGCQWGSLEFDCQRLKNFKSRGTPMVCKKCEARKQEDIRLQNEREAKLLTMLRAKDAWKCTCKGLKPGFRAYAALNDNWNHAQKCDLTPSYAGERRWDGANKGVTMDDLAFLNSRSKKKW